MRRGTKPLPAAPRGLWSRGTPRQRAGLLAAAGIAFYVVTSCGTASVPRSGMLGPSSSRPLPGVASGGDGAWAAPVEVLTPEPWVRVGILPDSWRVSIEAASGVVVFPIGTDGKLDGPGYKLARATLLLSRGWAENQGQGIPVFSIEPPRGSSSGRLRLLEADVELRAARVAPAAGPAEALSADATPYRGYLEVSAAAETLRVVNVVNIEDYVRGVVPNEFSLASTALEAVKAQAVAARTYALSQRAESASRPYDLCATPACQVYRGKASEHPLADRAVEETRGLLLEYHGAPIKALYTSACGGHTEDAENIFAGERARPYLRGVACAPHMGARKWEVRMTPGEVARAVGRYGPLSDVRDVQARRVGTSGRVLELAVIGGRDREEVVLKGLEVRRGLRLKESLFVMDREIDATGSVRRFVFTGKGWGHGVGLCQAGALGMARAGASFAQILRHYYTGVTLEKAY